MRPPTHFYVYYRIAGDAAAARATIGALMIEIEARTGIAGRLLARHDDPSTWMEVYEPVEHAAAFARTLAACARRCGAARIARGGRRTVERFAALDRGRARRIAAATRQQRA